MPKKVFVSGCFDMLHSGHVAFLEEASRLGELYVGIGSDQTILELKNRAPVNPEAERLYMLKALRCVKEAWVSSGSGIMDFEKEVLELKPDIFFVNTDGYSLAKEEFCRRNGIELRVSQRLPHSGLPARSTTALRSECRIPYRVELGGGWLDNPKVNSLHPGPVIVMSIQPDLEFNKRSGMATSSHQTAVRLWQNAIPEGDRQKLAYTLFCVDNPPGSEHISGSQDQLGICLPGINKLNYDNGYWPVSIESLTDSETLKYVQEHLYLIALPARGSNYSPFEGMQLTAEYAAEMAEATQRIWDAIKRRDTAAWGRASSDFLTAQCNMFPKMMTPEIRKTIEYYREQTCGMKITGAGGGGYLVAIAEKPLQNALKVRGIL